MSSFPSLMTNQLKLRFALKGDLQVSHRPDGRLQMPGGVSIGLLYPCIQESRYFAGGGGISLGLVRILAPVVALRIRSSWIAVANLPPQKTVFTVFTLATFDRTRHCGFTFCRTSLAKLNAALAKLPQDR
jgi:hypothetical protein